MAKATWVYNSPIINVSRPKLYEFITDTETYKKLSPLIKSVTDVKTTTAPDSGGITTLSWTSIEQFEFLPWGLFPYNNVLKCSSTQDERNNCVVFNLQSGGGVHVEFTWVLSEVEGGKSMAEETVVVTMPWLLKWFVVSKAKEVQLIRWARVKQLVEEENESQLEGGE